MKKNEIEVGGTYAAKVSGKVVGVRISSWGVPHDAQTGSPVAL